MDIGTMVAGRDGWLTEGQMELFKQVEIMFPSAWLRHYGAAQLETWERLMNNIIWLVGAIVIVLAILGFLGFR
jgi:hypothetical protein